MGKIIGELLLRLFLSNTLKSDKTTTIRSIVVVVIILFAMGLLQYSDAMLNVHKVRTINAIEQPTVILQHKLDSCLLLLDNTRNDLNYCRMHKFM